MNTDQQDSDGATRVAYILGVPLAENVMRQWPQMEEIVRTSKLVAMSKETSPSSRWKSAGVYISTMWSWSSGPATTATAACTGT